LKNIYTILIKEEYIEIIMEIYKDTLNKVKVLIEDELYSSAELLVFAFFYFFIIYKN